MNKRFVINIATVVAILLLSCQTLFGQQKWKYKDVPDPKSSPSWNYVSNPDKVLSDFAVAEINTYLKELEDSTTDQVAVVVVKNIEAGKTPKDFATALFRHWGIGQKDKNNGLLILLVVDQRRMEFEVGYGLEYILTDILTKQIQEQYMVPYAKSNDYDNCVLSGVQQVVAVLKNGTYITPPEEGNEVMPVPYGNDTPYSYAPATKSWTDKIPVVLFIIGFLLVYFFIKKYILSKSKLNQHNSFRTVKYQFIQFVINAASAALIMLGSIFQHWWQLVICLYLYVVIKQLVKTQAILKYCQTANLRFTDRVETYKNIRLHKLAVPKFLSYIFPFPITVFFKRIRAIIEDVRNQPVFSSDGREMTRMSEEDDDNHLKDNQIYEENNATVDYDVWKTLNNDEQQIFRYEQFSNFTECPSCTTVAYKMTGDRTLISATYDSTGEGEKTYSCGYCNHVKKVRYTIAKKQRSSSSSGSSGSSSSGGSSWGGGSSGGGGSGSSW